MARKDRATLTLDPELLTDVKARVGERGVSRYANGALRNQLQHDAMGEYLAQRERERGPLPDDLLREVASLIDLAYEPVSSERVRLRLRDRLGFEESPARLRDVAARALRAGVSLERILGKRALVEIVGDDIRIIDVDVPDDGSYGPR